MPETANSRLEMFCDGVFAIALTLLIIDIKIPPTENVSTTADLWLAIKHLLPTILAFLLSFITILITWVSHHNTFKLINKSSHPFIYANGLMLLAIVFIPFPTSLMGDYILTDHAAPAVVLYGAVNLLMSISWHLVTRAALNPNNPLTNSEKSMNTIRNIHKTGYYSLAINTTLTILAFWFPLAVAIIISLLWITWLVIGMNITGD